MVFIIGITISFFLCVALSLKKEKKTADYLLIAWLVVAALHQLFFYFSWSGIAMHYPHLLGLALPLPVLYAPMLYFYTTEITEEKPFNWRNALPHFLPFLVLLGLAVPFYSLSAAEKRAVFENGGSDYWWYEYLLQVWFIVATVLYTRWSLLRIWGTRRKTRDFYSNIERRNLVWLEIQSLGLAGICLLVLFFDDSIVFVGVTFLIVIMGLYGINQTAIFQTHQFTGEIPQNSNGRYQKSGLKTDDVELLFNQLQQLMQTEKTYTNPDLTLPELASELEVHPNYLSQVINEKANCNFYTYINTLRIEEFLSLSQQEKYRHYTLLALAFECGFNSKSTFNKYFKLQTGKTPSEFLSQ